MNSNDIEVQLDKKRAFHDLEKQLAIKDRHEYEQELLTAFQEAGDDKQLHNAIQWVRVLTRIGVHATYACQAWSANRYFTNTNMLP